MGACSVAPPPAAPRPQHDRESASSGSSGSCWSSGSWCSGSSGPLAGKLSGAEKNDATAFLPGKAESTKVFNQLKTFPGGDAIPVVIVYARDAGLTAADVAADQQERALRIDRGQGGGRHHAADHPQPEQESRADQREDRQQLRRQQAAGPASTRSAHSRALTCRSGLDTAFTGPGGFLRDSLKAFNGIDGTLLITTVLVVAADPAADLPKPACSGSSRWCRSAFAAGHGAGRGLPAGQGGPGGERSERRHPHGARLRRRYRLRAAADRPLSGRAASCTRTATTRWAVAVRQSAPALLSSGATVTIGLLCLLFSELESDQGSRPGRRGRRPVRPGRPAHPAAGAPDDLRPQALLAVHPEGRHGRA